MTTHVQSLSEAGQRATHILVREIGAADTIRFLRQFRNGAGNYTEERKALFKGMSVQDIIADIKSQREK